MVAHVSRIDPTAIRESADILAIIGELVPNPLQQVRARRSRLVDGVTL
jgi:hypothetical protein